MKQIALPAVVLLVLVGLATVALWPSASLDAENYRRFQDPQTLYSVLQSRVTRGNSIEEIEELIGPGVPLTEGVDEYRANIESLALRLPQQYPDGAHELDTFVSWAAGDGSVTLQFRNGWLVNHDPAQFSVYRPEYAIAGHETVPSGPPVRKFDDGQ